MAPSLESPPTNGVTKESFTLSAQTLALPTTTPETLIATIKNDPHLFLQPTTTLHAAALRSAKAFLDPLALDINEEQTQRLKASRKRKRGERDGDIKASDVLKIKKITLEGFGVDQIWEQVWRVLDAAGKETEGAIPKVAAKDGGLDGGLRGKLVKEVRFDDEGYEIGSDEDGDEVSGESGDEDEFEEEPEDVDMGDSEGFEDEEEDVDDGEAFEEEDGDMDGLVTGENDYEDDEELGQPSAEYVADPNGLNDGFFSIDDFNRQAEFLERQDAKGDPDDGAASDEEGVDWAADPLEASSSVAIKSRALGGSSRNQNDLDEEDDDDDDEEDEEGPTFGDMDLGAPEGESDEEADMDGADDYLDDMDDMAGMGNTNNIFYADFFAPPAKKANKNKRGRPHPHNFPQINGAANGTATKKPDQDDDMEQTMLRVHRDLFESDASGDEASDTEALDSGDPKSRRSTHERRQAALAAEIRALEAQSVAKRSWTLAGEARAADRPLNSLLEEDLDFERVGKPVPVITAEVCEDIEQMIKRRILAREFDEVVRRRPETLAGANVRRGKLDFELSNQKGKQSLAELYEEEHLKRTDPNYVDVKDEKVKAQHREIEGLWKEVCGKLDALSSWHYRPKPSAPQLEVRVDAPVLAMEDARPTAGGEVAGASALAPQEVYKAGEVGVKGEVVGGDGLPVKREELTRDQKKRRRMREKERIRKAGGLVGKADTKGVGVGRSKKEEEQNGIIGHLKRGGVKVIGKKGELQDVDGNTTRGRFAAITGGAFKL